VNFAAVIIMQRRLTFGKNTDGPAQQGNNKHNCIPYRQKGVVSCRTQPTQKPSQTHQDLLKRRRQQQQRSCRQHEAILSLYSQYLFICIMYIIYMYIPLKIRIEELFNVVDIVQLKKKTMEECLDLIRRYNKNSILGNNSAYHVCVQRIYGVSIHLNNPPRKHTKSRRMQCSKIITNLKMCDKSRLCVD
jgi:hypothetical protein